MSSSKTNTFFRGGYVTTLDAWKRYLADGHNIHFHTSSDREWSDEDDEEEEEEDEEEQQGGRAPMSEEERLLKEKTQAMFDFISDARQAFRSLYRKAPLEVRTRLVLPHSFTRVVKLPQGGKFYEWNIFIPTSWGGPSSRTKGPIDVDRERIMMFIDGANSLIKDDARREAGGFKFSDSDFKFERMPDWAVSRPILSDTELKDLIHAGPGVCKLWGLAPREFLSPYMP